MQSFKIRPHIHLADSLAEFCQEFQVGTGDLLFASRRLQTGALQGLAEGAILVDYRDFGSGELAEVVMTQQGRLMANNYVTLTRLDVEKIYASLY